MYHTQIKHIEHLRMPFIIYKSCLHFFCLEDCQFFGVDEASYEPCSNDIESVHVPPPEIQDARMNMDLQRLLDPLQESDVYGVDLFIQARDFISKYAH